jgi:hypothetical protein
MNEQSGKVEHERETLLGIANQCMNLHGDSQQPFALVFDFPALLVDNLKITDGVVYAPKSPPRSIFAFSRGFASA